MRTVAEIQTELARAQKARQDAKVSGAKDDEWYTSGLIAACLEKLLDAVGDEAWKAYRRFNEDRSDVFGWYGSSSSATVSIADYVKERADYQAKEQSDNGADPVQGTA